MQNFKEIFKKAIVAGIYVAIAATVFLIVNSKLENYLLASFLFSLALLVICSRGYFLYTGKIGYLLPYEKDGLKTIGTTLLGNIIGILTVVGLILLAGLDDKIIYVQKMVEKKLESNLFQVFSLSAFCGILMYCAVDGFYKIKSDLNKNLIVILAVVGFIVAGFEHSIANIAYFLFAKKINFEVLLYIIIMLAGNAFGAISINLLTNKKEQAKT